MRARPRTQTLKHPYISILNIQWRSHSRTRVSKMKLHYATIIFFWSVYLLLLSSDFLHGSSFTWRRRHPTFIILPLMLTLTVHSDSSLCINFILLHLSTKAQTLSDNCKWKSYFLDFNFSFWFLNPTKIVKIGISLQVERE